MYMISRLLFPVIFLISLVSARPLQAFWTEDGVPVSVASDYQYKPQVVSDGAGGTIITWYDHRGGTYNIYVQRVNASGTVEWTTDGVPICLASGIQRFPELVSDGYGGAIIAWPDSRGSDDDIYAQRINSLGTIEWFTNGVPVCTATDDQSYPQIVADGAGGAIITWYDKRKGDRDIYAQRINASGSVMWDSDGVSLCTLASEQYYPIIISDGASGAIVTWYDLRYGDYDIYAQRIDSIGKTQWIDNGVSLCGEKYNQWDPGIASDGAGGAIVTWHDDRSGKMDIYAQRVDAAGTVQWSSNGEPLCTAAENQIDPMIASDGVGGAIVTWYEDRSGNYDVYAQRIASSGTVQWPADGVPVSTTLEHQQQPRILSDGAGGAIITWIDERNGDADIYAQRLDASGLAHWATDGLAIALLPESQVFPEITTDGMGGAIIAWADTRAGDYDIYAQQISASGESGSLTPMIQSALDVPGDEGGWINLTWGASRHDYQTGAITQYTVWRALDTPAALAGLSAGPMEGVKTSVAEACHPGDVIQLAAMNGQIYYWMLISTMPAYRLQGYSSVVPTLFDLTPVCDDYHYFQVIAHTSDPSVFWISNPDSGRSEDNLAPDTPAMLAGEQLLAQAGLLLTWQANTESDLDCYNVYRGGSPGFTPGPGNLIESPENSFSIDSGWGWDSGYFYKVSAVDNNGNESDFATLSPEIVTNAGSAAVPKEVSLQQNYPNPFNPTTTISFFLPGAGHVSLTIFDAQGKRIRDLIEREFTGGQATAVWDGRNNSGEAVSSGVYFYRLTAENKVLTRKLTLLK